MKKIKIKAKDLKEVFKLTENKVFAKYKGNNVVVESVGNLLALVYNTKIKEFVTIHTTVKVLPKNVKRVNWLKILL